MLQSGSSGTIDTIVTSLLNSNASMYLTTSEIRSAILGRLRYLLNGSKIKTILLMGLFFQHQSFMKASITRARERQTMRTYMCCSTNIWYISIPGGVGTSNNRRNYFNGIQLLILFQMRTRLALRFLLIQGALFSLPQGVWLVTQLYSVNNGVLTRKP